MTLEFIQNALTWILAILTSILGWLFNNMWQEQKDMRRRLHEQAGEIQKLQILVVGNYATRPELDARMNMIVTAMEKGFDKIDTRMNEIHRELKHKADKPD